VVMGVVNLACLFLWGASSIPSFLAEGVE
jgi:hypothetical protein